MTRLARWYNIDIFWENPEVKEYHFSGTRSQIREATTSAALILMRSCILKYFSKVTFGKK